MLSLSKKAILLLTAAFCFCGAGDVSKGQTLFTKKVVEFGWDSCRPDYIAAHIREMEQRPFDGLIFFLKGANPVFDPRRWDETKLEEDFQYLPRISWEKFTDNFVAMNVSTGDERAEQDWFDDDHWNAIVDHAHTFARAAKLGKCVGLCFDPEPYGKNPWDYREAAHHDTKSFAEYEAVVRMRGRQFIEAIESEFPSPKILTLFLFSVFPEFYSAQTGVSREELFSQHPYGLYPAFFLGMLEGCSQQTEFIDGNESSYYYTDKGAYFAAYHRIMQGPRSIVDRELWRKYRSHVSVGQALYVDQCFGLRTMETLGNFMSAEERAAWFEHNTYWALYTTDEYVWCYGERLDWWKTRDVPPGAEQALVSARETIRAGKALSVDFESIRDAAKARASTETRNKAPERVLVLHKRKQDMAAPVIDGDLNDPAWNSATGAEPFVAPGTKKDPPKVQTSARVFYDDAGIYVGINAQEPAVQKLQVNAVSGTLSVFEKESVEAFIALPEGSGRYFHVGVCPTGASWWGLHKGEETLRTYDTYYQNAAARPGDNCWTVEIFIPWAALGVESAQSGMKLRANLTRSTAEHGELSSWSPVVYNFLEPDSFGEWVLE